MEILPIRILIKNTKLAFTWHNLAREIISNRGVCVCVCVGVCVCRCRCVITCIYILGAAIICLRCYDWAYSCTPRKWNRRGNQAAIHRHFLCFAIGLQNELWSHNSPTFHNNLGIAHQEKFEGCWNTYWSRETPRKAWCSKHWLA